MASGIGAEWVEVSSWKSPQDLFLPIVLKSDLSGSLELGRAVLMRQHIHGRHGMRAMMKFFLWLLPLSKKYGAEF